MRRKIYICILACSMMFGMEAGSVQASEGNLPVAEEETQTETTNEFDSEDSRDEAVESESEDEVGTVDAESESDEGTEKSEKTEIETIESEEEELETVKSEKLGNEESGDEGEEPKEEEDTVTPVEAFVIRFYTKALEREPDEEGVQYWTNALETGSKDGAGIAEMFLFGNEFKTRNVSNSSFVDILYQVFMDRAADEEGKSYWVGLLTQGVSRKTICGKFINSAEFAKICENYGIKRGKFASSDDDSDEITNAVQVNEKQVAFVRQAYENIFGRAADEEGLYYYASRISSKEITGSGLLETFLNSEEFSKKGLSDEAYIKVLYQACLGREADEDGLKYWLSIKDKGVSNTYIAYKFSESKEFSVLCESAGIEKGTISLKEARDKNLNMTGYVYRCYEKTLNRVPDVDGLNYWCKGLLEGRYNAEKVAMNFVFSQEVNNKNLSDTEFVKVLYRVFMGREADTSGLEYWVGRLAAGRNRKAVFYGFARSNEFAQILSTFGLSISSDKMEGAVYEWSDSTEDNADAAVKGTYRIMGASTVTVQQMVDYFNYVMSTYPSYYQGTEIATVEQLCQVYYEEAQAEGVKVEVAFCQAMLETGFLKFGGDVDISQYNFAGLGATGNVAGNAFSTPREGIRAQIQHLKAYASTDSLNQTCVDTRFRYVKRGSAIYVEWLGIQENPYGTGWATGKNYGVRIKKMIDKLKTF